MPIRARLATAGADSAHFAPLAGLTAERVIETGPALKLMQRLDGKLSGLTSRVVQFVAAGPEDDTAAIAGAYAALSAERGNRGVLLADERGPGPGLVETVLAGRPPAEAATARSFRLSSARLTVDGATMARLAEPALWEVLRRCYDEVVIDSGPAAISRSALLTAPRADAVVLVVQAGRTRFESLRRLMQDLAEVHAPVFGAVLANRHDPVPGILRRWL